MLLLSIIVLLLAPGCGEDAAPAPASPPPGAAAPTAVPSFTPPPLPHLTLESQGPRAAERVQMVEEGVMGWGITNTAVIDAMLAVPRHEFIPAEYQFEAYANHPVPIGYGQTISQPFVVAMMTEAAQVEAGDKVLEVGAGSGYQAAALAEIAANVYTVEIVEALAERAEATLAELGYENVTVRHGDGYFGWEEQAPFDAILVTAAPDHIPHPLVNQLKEGAHMIIPVGPVGGFQTLWRVTQTADGVQTENLGSVRFVPLTREEESGE
jgi:protein-L-isoaspartate(D-aspartate) O-methyltransferase